MLYYQGYTVSFQEVPDEISLVIQVADCPHHCPGCHSPQLQMPIGDPLFKDLPRMLTEYEDAITCVCFMGEGRDDAELHACHGIVKAWGLKTCLYTGGYGMHGCKWDYIKIGPYIEENGPLTSRTTNQRMIRVNWDTLDPKNALTDITDKFWTSVIPE